MLLSLLFSCSGAASGKAELSDTGQSGWDGETGPVDDDESESDTGVAVKPSWYAPVAELDVVGGEVSADASTAAVRVLDQDGKTVACEIPLDPSTFLVGDPPDAGIAWWWTVEVPTDGCASLPTPLGLGIGEMQADVAAWLGAEGLRDGALYGAYVQAPEGPLYAFGWAGTAEDVKSAEDASLPPPDGRYQVVPLYLLHL